MNQDLKNLFLNSQLRHDFLLELNKPEIKVVSFDVFDTLLRRKCLNPQDIFIEVAKKAISLKLLVGVSQSDYLNIRINAESKARELSVEEDIEFNEIFEQMFFDIQTIEGLKKIELEVENDFLFADPFALMLVELASEANKKLVITSDMYLPEHVIKNFISTKLPSNINFEYFFISSKTKKTKSTANQFRYISDYLDISLESILHVGDNFHADVKSARSCGLKALLFNVPSWIQEVFKREEALQVNLDSNIFYARIFSAILIPKNLSESARFFYYYGCVINGPTLAGFTKWIIAYQKIIGKHEVLCIMREGDIYEKCLTKLSPKIDATKFYASRKSTYLASLDEDTYLTNLIPALARNTYTLNDLYMEFKLGYLPKILQPFKETELYKLESISLGEKLVIEYVNNELDKQKLHIKEQIIESKKRLNAYFEQQRKTNLPFIFIDFGAGGTIQSQLHAALVMKAESNLLFYANSRAYSKTTRQHFSSFLPLNPKTKRAISTISRSPELLEIVLVGLEQTTLGYHDSEDGIVLPIQPKRSYSPLHIEKIVHFNLGVEHYMTLSQYLDCDENTEQNRESFALLLERLINIPTVEEATYLGLLAHEDNFGSDREYPIIGDKILKELSLKPAEKYWREYCTNPNANLYSTPWPQGALTMLDGNIIYDFSQLKGYRDKHKESINLILENLKSVSLEKGIIVYGAGEFFSELEPMIKHCGIKIAFIVDKRASFKNFMIKDYTVISLEQLEEGIDLPVVVASKAFLIEIRNNLQNKLGKETLIITC